MAARLRRPWKVQNFCLVSVLCPCISLCLADSMANGQAIQLILSSVTLVSACFMFWAASEQATMRLHSLQLVVCGSFLLIAVTLVVLSSLQLQLHCMSARGNIVAVVDVLIYLSLTIPPIFEFIALWQILYPWEQFYRLTRLLVFVFLILKTALAFSLIPSLANKTIVFKVFLLLYASDYLILLWGGVLACLKVRGRRTLIVLILTEMATPLFILLLTFVLLILGWLRVYEGGFTTIRLILLASTSTCAARFAVIRLFRTSTSLNDAEQELRQQGRCELIQDGAQQCLQAPPAIHHIALSSYSLSE